MKIGSISAKGVPKRIIKSFDSLLNRLDEGISPFDLGGVILKSNHSLIRFRSGDFRLICNRNDLVPIRIVSRNCLNKKSRRYL